MPTTTLNATKGARIASSGGTSLGAGASDYLPVGLYSGFLYRSLLGFSYSFSGWTAITSAVLHLKTSGQFYVAFGSDPDIIVRRLTGSWSEGSSSSLSGSNSVNWDNQPAATTTNDVTADISTAENAAVSIDITALMQDALAAGVFYGLKLYAVDEGTATDVTEFYSDDTSDKPYITVTYSTNTAPTAPTLVSPVSDAIVNTLAPALDLHHNDPDAGDSVSGVEVQVFEDDGTTLKWDSGMIARVITGTYTSTSVTYAGPALTGNTFYKWRARTKDAAGAVGAWSALARFKVNSSPTAPTISIAGTDTDITDLTPDITVGHNDPDPSDSLMQAYRVIITDSTGAQVWDSGDTAITPTAATTITYAGPALSWRASYTVIARTQDANGAWGPYSSGTTFSTHSTAKPTSLNPNAGETASSVAPTLTGNRGQSSDTLASCEIEVYASDGTTLIWSTGVFTSGVTSSSFSKVYAGPALSALTTYKWRARVTGVIGGTSDWATLRSFVTPDASAPNITTPLGTGIADLTPDMTFTRAGSNFNKHELTVYEEDGTTVIWTDSPASYTAVDTKTVTYAGPALDWNTTYKWKVRVSADGGTLWSDYAGPVAFTTDSALIPTLTAPIDSSWQTTTTPTFTGTTPETMTHVRILVYASDQTTVVWDSGYVAATGTSFSVAYAGPALSKGSTYYWTAQYEKTGDIPGDVAPLESFHINADPSAPTGLSPASGSTVADTVAPSYVSTYEDADRAVWGDVPTVLTVEVYRNSDDTLMHTLTKNTGLVAGQNSVARTAEGTALSYEVQYKYRCRYTDSKSAAGTWSPYILFKPSQSPSIAVTSPSGTVGSPAFSVGWTFTSPAGKSQASYRVVVVRQSDLVTVYDSGVQTSSLATADVPAGYLANGESYEVQVYATDSDGLSAHDSVTTSQLYGATTVTATWTPPDALTNFLVSTNPDASTVNLSWDVSLLADADFARYVVYRRVATDESWTPYAEKSTKTDTAMTDYLAANGTVYDYKVTQFKAVVGDVDLESLDSDIASAILDADVWFVIGADGSSSHSFELPVVSESHQRPVQQELFEPLGSRRKRIARGNVLGAEGQLEVNWESSEVAQAKVWLNYIRENPGPHTLKSPFGDIWLVEFAGPVEKYTNGGHMSTTLAWTEVA